MARTSSSPPWRGSGEAGPWRWHVIDATHGWPDDVPREDFWLFDSRHLFDLRYAADGTWLGVEPVTEPGCLAEACAVRDAA